MSYKIAVLGSGSWGSATAHHLSKSPPVVLWGRSESVVSEINSQHKNSKYFPLDPLNKEVKATTNLEEAVTGASLIVFAVPSSAFAEVASDAIPFANKTAPVVSLAKGFQSQTNKRLTEVLVDAGFERERVSVLSGPCFALEVLQGLPTAAVVASSSVDTANAVAAAFHHHWFRVYTSTDVIGVELCGAVKNVIALACGVIDGLKLGTNARAALITRGLKEIKQLVVAMGGMEETVYGLSGLGDLVLTSTGDLSRNRRVGIALGEGGSLQEILNSMGQVAESVKTAEKVLELAQAKSVSMPIVEAVCRVLREEVSANEMVEELLRRERKPEHEA